MDTMDPPNALRRPAVPTSLCMCTVEETGDSIVRDHLVRSESTACVDRNGGIAMVCRGALDGIDGLDGCCIADDPQRPAAIDRSRAPCTGAHTLFSCIGTRESIDRPTDATNPYTHQLTPQRAGRPQAAAFASFHLYIRSRRPPQAAAAAASEQMAAAAPSGSGSEGGSHGNGGSGYSWQAQCQMGKVQGEMAVGADGLYWRQDGWVWVCFVCVE